MRNRQVNNQSVFKPLMRYAKPHMKLLIAALILAAISVAGTLYAPILVGNSVDLIIGKGNVDFHALDDELILLGVVIIITAVSQWVMSLYTNKVAYKMSRSIRSAAFANIQKLPLRYIDSHAHGDIISRLLTDVEQISDGLLMGFAHLFTGVITIVGTLCFMLSINVKITLIVVVITPVSLFVAKFIAKNTFVLFKLQSESRGEMTSHIDEMIGNQKLVKAFGREEQSQKKFEQLNGDLAHISVKAIFFSSLTNPTTRFINGLVYNSVAIIGAFTVIGGAFTVGQLSCFLTYANQYAKPFNEISGVITELQSALASAKRVFEIIDEPIEESDSENSVALESVDGTLDVKDVSFSYDPQVPLISDFNLSVKSGQRIAIVGPTGCGKTTIINLLMRFYDVTDGEIALSGYPIKDCTRDSMRSMYGMVLQETWLKTATIRENLSYGKPDATLDEVISAAKSAHCHSFVKRLPNGYDTVVSEDGGSLSQGQKQLLCIARVMLSLPPMLILDEATSSIDTRTEIIVQKTFKKMMQGRTSFIIAHRLSTIKEADCILVMDKGHIVEQGTHDELMNKNGFYANLYNSQFAV